MAPEVSARLRTPYWPGSVAFRSAEALSCSGDVAALAHEAPREVSSLTYSSQNFVSQFTCVNPGRSTARYEALTAWARVAYYARRPTSFEGLEFVSRRGFISGNRLCQRCRR